MPGFFHRDSGGIKLKASWFQGKHFTGWAMSPAPCPSSRLPSTLYYGLLHSGDFSYLEDSVNFCWKLNGISLSALAEIVCICLSFARPFKCSTLLTTAVWMWNVPRGFIYLKTWSQWWYSLGRLWNLYEMKPCWRKWVIVWYGRSFCICVAFIG